MNVPNPQRPGTEPSGYRNARRALGFASGSVSLTVGVLVLIGWVADVTVLRNVLPGLPTMKANTALCFALAGVSLLSTALNWRRLPRMQALALGLPLLVALIALLTLAEYALGADLGIDQLLIHAPADFHGAPFPGRMAPVTAVGFAVIGATLFLIQTGRAPVLTQSLAVASVLFSSLCCLSYLYGLHALRAVAPFSSVAIHSAAAFLIVSIGLLSMSPARGLVALIVSEDVDGALARRFLPVAILVPVVMVWLQLEGHRRGWYGLEFGLALSALANIIFCSALVVATALTVRRSAAEREAAEAALQESEQRYRLLLEGVPQLVWTCSPDGGCDYLSPQWVRYTGVPEAAQLGYGWLGAVYAQDRTRVMERWEEAVQTGRPFDVEFRLRNARGEYRWFKTRAVPFTEHGETKKWFGTNTDIQEQRLAEDELRELNATLERRVEERPRLCVKVKNTSGPSSMRSSSSSA